MSKKTIIIICVCVVLIPVLLISAFVGISIISAGVMLHGSASDIAEDTVGTIDSLGKDAFNRQFEQYEGESVRVSTVKILMAKVINNNENFGDSKVKIAYKSVSGENDVTASAESSMLNKIQDSLTSEQKYKIEISEYSKDGTISVITIYEI